MQQLHWLRFFVSHPLLSHGIPIQIPMDLLFTITGEMPVTGHFKTSHSWALQNQPPLTVKK
jgi:hypothetical protein